jgi:hypothetical protein
LFTIIGHGKRAVLDRYFDGITVEKLRSEEGLEMICDKLKLRRPNIPATNQIG